MKKKGKDLPKLPRFNAPKQLTSVVFQTKKDKAKSRKNLKHLTNDDED